VGFGILAAIAVATKDQAYGPLVPSILLLIGLHITAFRASPRLGESIWKAPIALILAGLVAYAVANGIVFRPGRFINHVKFLLNFEQTFVNVVNFEGVVRERSIEGYLLVVQDVTVATYQSLGPFILLAGVAGIFAIWRRERFIWFVTAMLLGYLVLVIAPIRHMHYRWAMMPALFLVFPAARLIVMGLEAGGARRMVTMAAAVVGIGWLGAWALDMRYQVWKDARNPASEWLADNARPGDRVGFFGSVGQLPRIPRDVMPVSIESDSASRRLVDSGVRLVLVIPDYSSQGGAGIERSRYLPESTYNQLLDGSLGFTRVAHFRTQPLPLLGRSLLGEIPWVNPPVQIFERTR
jgi:hypothetical protein